MKFTKIIILSFFLSAFTFDVFAKVSVIKWQENAELNATGKSSEITIQAKALDIPKNQVLTSFSISFDRKQHIKLNQVICDSQNADYSFQNNVLTVKFPIPRVNNDNINLYFSYNETYDQVHRFLREEQIYVPSFAAGANAQVKISFPWYLESATLNPNVTKIGDSFVYNNLVPPKGVRESIKLTPLQSIWNVSLRVRITALGEAPASIAASLPEYFQNPSQKVDDLSIGTNVLRFQRASTNNRNIFTFEGAEKKEIVIENKAIISTGKNNRGRFNRNPDDYNKVTQEETALLSGLVEKIKQSPRFEALPLYAKIGRFVNEFIQYDLGYSGKLPALKDILQNRTGVCTEYAKLFDALSRVAGIPSLIIEGASCGEYDKCQGHAWNLIFYEGQWIEVDPTWDLMSGIVSSSHIYFNDRGKGEVQIRYLGGKDKIESRIEFEMKEITN